MQWDYGKFILKQLDYSPSFSTSERSHTIGTLKLPQHALRARLEKQIIALQVQSTKAFLKEILNVWI